jgi:hypothetical protein
MSGDENQYSADLILILGSKLHKSTLIDFALDGEGASESNG